MIYARPTFAFLAMTFLFGLGLSSYAQNPKGKLNQLFGLYCLCNLIWNANDFLIFINNSVLQLWFYRFTGFMACFIGPFLLQFSLTAGQIATTKLGRRIIRSSFTIAIILAALSLTPLMLRGVEIDKVGFGLIEKPGILYPVFAFFLLSQLSLSFLPFFLSLRNPPSLKKQRIMVFSIGLGFGILSLTTYVMSFIGHDWPWIYFPLQSISTFIFSYSIYQYDLIPTRLVLKRTILVLGISIVMGMLFIPVFYWFLHSIGGIPKQLVENFFIFTLTTGFILALGPLIYGIVVRRYSIFQDTVSSQITHEFKTPLVSIQSARAFLEDALQKPQSTDPAKLKEYLDIIARNSDRLQKVVSEVLDFNRIKDLSSMDEKVDIDLNNLLQQLASDFRIRHSKIILRCDQPVHFIGSEEGMKQILTNLIANAIKFCPTNNITIQAVKDENQILISVIDEGKGIAPQNLARIFEPFFKTTAPNQAHGSGLGLSIAKKWVEAHGGKIWAESEGEGKGTTVSFTVPIN